MEVSNEEGFVIDVSPRIAYPDIGIASCLHSPFSLPSLFLLHIIKRSSSIIPLGIITIALCTPVVLSPQQMVVL